MEAYLSFSQENLWYEIWPELSLAIGAIVVLGINLFYKSDSKNGLSGSLAILFQAILLVFHLFDYLAWHHTFDRTTFSGMLHQGIQGDVMRSFFLLASLLVSIIGHRYIRKHSLRIGEFHHLVMLASAGLMLLCQSSHFVMLFVALECVALCFYALVAFNRESAKSLESGIKYLIFGALSSSFLLFGIVLLYGVGSNPEAWGATFYGAEVRDALSFGYLEDLIRENPDHLLIRTGMVLIIAGIAFKIGAAPFQIWVPDVYHGSPMPITAFLSVSSKAAGFFILLNLVNGPFSGAVNFLLPLLGFVATFTIFFGNLAACAQRNLKRMLGLSGVAHAGYLLVAIMASMVFPGDSDRAVWVLFFYMFVYLVASFSVFAVMSLADLPDDNEHEFSDYESLARKHPLLGFAIVCGIGSLAGIPPFAGFIAKLLLVSIAFEAGLYLSLAAMVIGVVISIYYYFGWIREITFHPRPVFDDDEPRKDPWSKLSETGLIKVVLVTLTVFSLILGIWQGPFGDTF